MLSSLHIENVALIKENTLLFGGGFTVLTGETGAGKSIIIDALSLLCGGRSDKELIRTGESYAFVEGCFDGLEDETLEGLASLGVYPDEDGALFLSRRVSADGRSTARIGDRQVPSSRLRAVAELLVNIHGQQDTLLLSDKARHLPLIDSYAGTAQLVAEYAALYSRFTALENQIENEKQKAKDSAFRREMIEYKLQALKKAKLRPQEEDELLQSRKRLRAAERIAAGASGAYSLLYEEDGSAGERVYDAISALSPLRDALPETAELLERLESIKCEIDDIADTLKGFAETDADTAATKLDEVETRLELIAELKRRFATDYDGLLSAREKLMAELESIDGSDEYIEELVREREECEKQMLAAAATLSEERRSAATGLEESVKQSLSQLDMPSVGFEVRFSTVPPRVDGCDEAELLIAPNAGEEPKPLSKIASGGELARIMLAFKTALAETEKTPVMVFDEIDTGISGKTAQKTGLALKRLSSSAGTQVLCVTHSAQIAALADTHLLVSKHEEGGRTKSRVCALDRTGRIDELARIIGGINVGEATLNAARELLDNAGRL